MKIVIIAILGVFLFAGCSGKFWTIGADKGYCEEQGCDYSDAGVCGSPYEILQNKELAKKVAYERIKCNCAGAFNESAK
ncbi:hypothetical protein [Sulfurimonas sp.]